MKSLTLTAPFNRSLFGVLLLLLAFALPSYAANFTWINTAGGFWSDFASWSPNGVPGPADTANITNSGTYIITLDFGPTVQVLNLGAPSGSQTISNAANDLTITSSGTIGANGILNFFGGSLTATNTTVNGILNCAGASISGQITIATNGQGYFSNGGTNTLAATFTNQATTFWTGGQINFNQGRIVNRPGAVMEIQSDQSMGGVAADPLSFFNAGTLRKSVSTGITSISVPFTNSGTIIPASGLLSVLGNVTLPGSSTLHFPLGGTNLGSQFGQFQVGGAFRFGGVLSVSNVATPNFPDTFRVVSCGSHSGGFSAHNLPALTGGNFLQVMCDAVGISIVTHNTNAPALPPPTNLVSQTVAVGDTATFFIAPNGLPPFSYGWLSNGITIPGQTNSSLVLNNVQLSSAATYCVSVASFDPATNLYCATLTVLSPPVFTTQPAGQTFTAGANITLTAAASGTAPFRYQWRNNGANIIGATSSAYTIANAQPTDAGLYSVLIANPVHVTVSSNALLKFTGASQLMADNFAARITTNASAAVVLGNNTNATREAGEPLIAGKFGSNSMWLQWNAPASGTVTFNTKGSAFDTLLSCYNPTNSTPSLTNIALVAANDDKDGKSFTSEIVFQANAGTNYYIAVDGLDGARGEIVLNWSLVTNTTVLPKIAAQPSDATVSAGGTATFSLTVTNLNVSSYQWYYNDCLALAAGTNATLVLTNIAITDLGFYSVEVTATNGQRVVSRHASLEIGPAGSISADKFADMLFGQPGGFSAIKGGKDPWASFPSVTIGSLGTQIINTWNSTTDRGEPTHSSTIGGSSRWYKLSATASALLVIDTIGSDFDTVLQIWTGSDIFSLNLIANDNNGAPDGIRSKVSFPAVSGTDYLIEVDGVTSAQGNVVLNWKEGVPPAAATPIVLFMNENESTMLQGGGTGANPPPTYQWQRNGVNILGATTSTYNLSTVQFNSGGIYTVIVSNLMGIVTNTIAYVSIEAPLRIAKETANYRITGSATQAMALQSSTNLFVWKPLMTNFDSKVAINYLDPVLPFFTNRFYRLKSH